MTADKLLALFFEELLSSARGLEQVMKSFLRALYLLTKLALSLCATFVFSFLFYIPKLVKKESPAKSVEVEDIHRRSIGHPWSHPPLY